MRNNLIFCEKNLEDHRLGVQDKRTSIVYAKPKEMAEEIGCGECLDFLKCKYAQRIIDLTK